MAIERKSMNSTTRKKVNERDGNRCQKCHGKKHLHLHHIIPVVDGQDDSPENLITLCKYCHDEWEHLINAHTEIVDFHAWLKIPPALALVAAFSKEEWWTEQLTAKEAREGIIQGYGMMREIRSYEDD